MIIEIIIIYLTICYLVSPFIFYKYMRDDPKDDPHIKHDYRMMFFILWTCSGIVTPVIVFGLIAERVLLGGKEL